MAEPLWSAQGQSQSQAQKSRPPLIPVALAAIALLAALGWLAWKANRASWARNEALPKAASLAEHKQFAEATALAEQAERYLVGDPVLQKLWSDIALEVSVESNPTGGQVELRHGELRPRRGPAR